LHLDAFGSFEEVLSIIPVYFPFLKTEDGPFWT
jgi:hypothetical protein